MPKPNDPKYLNQWGLLNIGASVAWDHTKGSDKVKIAVIDSGIQLDNDFLLVHPDLKDVRLGFGADYAKGEYRPRDTSNRGHGTKVVGIVAADTDNGEGISGMNWYSNVIIYKISDDDGYFNSTRIVKAINDLIITHYDHHIIINISSGYPIDDGNMIFNSCKLASEKGMIICASVGNIRDDRPKEIDIPARYSTEIKGLIAVGATTKLGDVCNFSKRGKEVTVVAPGENILTTTLPIIPGTYYGEVSGTSFATPFVTGLASLIWSKHPELTNEEVKDIIRNTARRYHRVPLPDPGYGYGIIDAGAALAQCGWEVSLESKRELKFTNVNEGETRVLEVKFSVKSFHKTTFEIVKGLSDGFQAPWGTSVSLDKTTDYYPPREVVFPISYTGMAPGDHHFGKITVRCVETGEEWDISANTIAEDHPARDQLGERKQGIDAVSSER